MDASTTRGNNNGTLLRLARVARRWTQLDLARATGLTAIRISKLETGWAQARPDELARIVAALGIDPRSVEEAR